MDVYFYTILYPFIPTGFAKKTIPSIPCQPTSFNEAGIIFYLCHYIQSLFILLVILQVFTNVLSNNAARTIPVNSGIAITIAIGFVYAKNPFNPILFYTSVKFYIKYPITTPLTAIIQLSTNTDIPINALFPDSILHLIDLFLKLVRGRTFDCGTQHHHRAKSSTPVKMAFLSLLFTKLVYSFSHISNLR